MIYYFAEISKKHLWISHIQNDDFENAYTHRCVFSKFRFYAFCGKMFD